MEVVSERVHYFVKLTARVSSGSFLNINLMNHTMR